MKKIAVVGAGTMGNGIAHTFAQNGYLVNLIDISEEALERGFANISTNLYRMIAKDSISEEDKTNTLANIKKFTTLRDGVQDVDLVIEAATENCKIKISVFKKLDQLCDPRTILATNTSSISITQIASITKRPDNDSRTDAPGHHCHHIDPRPRYWCRPRAHPGYQEIAHGPVCWKIPQ